MLTNQRDHGGGLDAAIAEFGGKRQDWIDLSTGINPCGYPVPTLPNHIWQALPDQGAMRDLLAAARQFWNIPNELDIVAAGGVSALITQIPDLAQGQTVTIRKPTYNEHEAAFVNAGYDLSSEGDAQVIVHPNNPDGRRFEASEIMASHQKMTIIDESFCDCSPQESRIELARHDGVLILKGLGKFWGLAGLRLGFAIAKPDLVASLANRLGPWAVSGPALIIGAAALGDEDWVAKTRQRLANDARRLDNVCISSGLDKAGGTDLFRLYSCSNSDTVFRKLASEHILTRVFPYSKNWIRIGLPYGEANWRRLENGLGA